MKHGSRPSSLASLPLLLWVALPLACDGNAGTEGSGKAAKADPKSVANTNPAQHEANKDGAAQASVLEVDEIVDAPAGSKTSDKLVEDANATVKAIEDARTAIAAKKKKKARKALVAARAAMDRIIAERPIVDVTLELWTKDKELDGLEVAQTVQTIPLFASLDRLETLVASPDAISARKKQREGAKDGELTVDEKQADLQIVDANLVYTEIDMPIASTQVHVLAAQELLGEGKLAEADGVLEQALGSLEVLEFIEQAPEYRARRDIWDAEAAFARGDLKTAQARLETAKKILDGISADEAAGQEAHLVTKALLDEIAPLLGTLKPTDAGQASALQQLRRSAWGFGQRAAAVMMLNKRRAEESLALADALMYLEKAQSEGLYDGADAAGGALVMAEAMLGAAAKKVAPATKPMVDDIKNRTEKLVALDVKGQRDTEKIKGLHEELKFELRMLMFDLHLPIVASAP